MIVVGRTFDASGLAVPSRVEIAPVFLSLLSRLAASFECSLFYLPFDRTAAESEDYYAD